jgi:hypothetical protein
MKGHLGKQHSSVTLERRCRFGIPPHVRLRTLRREAAFVRHARGDSSLRLASDAFLNRLQRPITRTGS